MAFPRPLRRYQRLALAAFEQQRSANNRRAYLVLPPGAGKTVLGLEAAR
jgi:superfamily II DNA or RNA helicase